MRDINKKIIFIAALIVTMVFANCKKKEEDKTPQLAAAALILNSKQSSTSTTTATTASKVQKNYMDILEKKLVAAGLTQNQARIISQGKKRTKTKKSALEFSIIEAQKRGINVRAYTRADSVDSAIEIADTSDVTQVVPTMTADSMNALEDAIDADLEPGEESTDTGAPDITPAEVAAGKKPSLPQIAGIISQAAVESTAITKTEGAKETLDTTKKTDIVGIIASVAVANSDKIINAASKAYDKYKKSNLKTNKTTTKTTRYVAAGATKSIGKVGLAGSKKNITAAASKIAKGATRGISVSVKQPPKPNNKKPVVKAVKKGKKSILAFEVRSNEPAYQKRQFTTEPTDSTTEPTQDQEVSNAVIGVSIALKDISSNTSTSIVGGKVVRQTTTVTLANSDIADAMKAITAGATSGLNEMVPVTGTPMDATTTGVYQVTSPDVMAQYAKAITAGATIAIPRAANLYGNTTALTNTQQTDMQTMMKAATAGAITALDQLTVPLGSGVTPVAIAGTSAASTTPTGATVSPDNARNILLQSITEGGVTAAGNLGASGASKANILSMVGSANAGAIAALSSAGLNQADAAVAALCLSAGAVSGIDQVKVTTIKKMIRQDGTTTVTETSTAIDKADYASSLQNITNQGVEAIGSVKDTLKLTDASTLGTFATNVAAGATASIDDLGLTKTEIKNLDLVKAISRGSIGKLDDIGVPTSSIDTVTKSLNAQVYDEVAACTDPTTGSALFSEIIDFSEFQDELQNAAQESVTDLPADAQTEMNAIDWNAYNTALDNPNATLADVTGDPAFTEIVDCTDPTNATATACSSTDIPTDTYDPAAIDTSTSSGATVSQ